MVNEGYPFCAVVNVKSVGNHVIVKRQFNTLMVHKHTKGIYKQKRIGMWKRGEGSLASFCIIVEGLYRSHKISFFR
jgi:hypothetical protein